MNKNYQEIIVDVNDSLMTVFKRMDSSERKLLLVYKNNKYFSLISVGDIQRAILTGHAMESPIEKILREDIKVAYNNESRESIIQQIKDHRMEFIPVLNRTNHELSEVIFWEDVFKTEERSIKKPLSCPVVIMAGGQGSRLKPITNIIPKPLIPIGERPIMQWIIDSFTEHNVNQFYTSVNYKKEMIRRFFEEIENKSYSIDYFTEEKPLGTAGSLHLLKGQLNETFFVSNCDILIRDDYSEMMRFHKENRNVLTAIAVVKNYSIPYGTMETSAEGLLLELKEKPNYTFFVNAGMYILEPSVLEEIPINEFFHITELMEKLKNKGERVGVYPVSEGSWYDIGEWDQYNNTMKRLGLSPINI